MPIVVISETPGMSAEQFDQVAGEVGLTDGLPEGCLAHIARMGPDGSTWRDVMVWESGAQAKQFMDEKLRPAIDRCGARAIWGPPENWEAHTVLL